MKRNIRIDYIFNNSIVGVKDSTLRYLRLKHKYMPVKLRDSWKREVF